MTERMLPKRLYNIWKKMRQRCRERPEYKHVSVCDEWGTYLVFKAWALANGYDETLTIDRLDNTKGYEPDNCRWTDRKGQSRNRRVNILTEKTAGEVKWLSAIARLPSSAIGHVYGISTKTVVDVRYAKTWGDVPAVHPSGETYKRVRKLIAATGGYRRGIVSL